MTVVLKFENVTFHKAAGVKPKINCGKCDFNSWRECTFTSIKEIRNGCDYGANGYWSFEDAPKKEVIND